MNQRLKHTLKKSGRTNQLKRKRVNYVHILHFSGVATFLIPFILIACYVTRLIDMSRMTIAITVAFGILFDAFFYFTSSRWLNSDDKTKDISLAGGIFYWSVITALIMHIAVHLQLEYAPMAIYIIAQICLVYNWIGRERELLYWILYGYISLALMALCCHYTLSDIIYQSVIMALCMCIRREKQRNFWRRLKDASVITDATAQAETDAMTKLLNRRGLQNRLGTLWPMCERQGTEVSIIMLDIDNFKKYNDSFGHLKGDECIRRVTGEIRDCVRRKTDSAARMGGEEFLIFLYGTDGQDALRWAANLKRRIEGMRIPQSDANFLPYVTVSMGIASKQVEQGDVFWEMQNKADQELYMAKENGRACICMDGKCYMKTDPGMNGGLAVGGQRSFRAL